MGASTICLRLKVSDVASSLVLGDEVEEKLMLKLPKRITLERMEGLRDMSL